MQLRAIDKVDAISAEEFKKNYYRPMKPLVITGLAKQWPAYCKWNWDYFKSVVGEVKVGVYNNVKSDAYTPVNTADDYMKFSDYIEMVRKGPAEWRIFLFNIFEHAPQVTQDFTWPEHLIKAMATLPRSPATAPAAKTAHSLPAAVARREEAVLAWVAATSSIRGQ